MRKLLTAVTGSIVFLTATPLAFAQATVDPCQGANASAFGFLCNLGKNQNGKFSVGYTLGLLINVMFVIAAMIALWFLVQGGIRWITSQGDTKNVEGARNQIIAAAVGLAVTFLSYLIINVLLQFFIGTSLNNVSIPSLK